MEIKYNNLEKKIEDQHVSIDRIEQHLIKKNILFFGIEETKIIWRIRRSYTENNHRNHEYTMRETRYRVGKKNRKANRKD